MVSKQTISFQFYFGNKVLSWMSPPNVGKLLLILCYWMMISGMVTRGPILNDAYYWARIGLRSAWIGLTQVPLVFLLASKANIIGFTTGSSHERLNFFHRWVSRTLLITITVYGAFFFCEWIRADFVAFELSLLTMVKYGIGCWAILVWSTFSSLLPLRRMAYEVFVIQHMAATAIFLWLPCQHLYLQISGIALFESHPFTIANMYIKPADQHTSNDIQLAVRVHSGFSRKLNQHALKNNSTSVTAFITGPFGCPPNWEAFETFCLISASTGASFTLPILESILHNSRRGCVRRINFLLAVQDKLHKEFYVSRLTRAVSTAKKLGILLIVEIAVTDDGYQRLSPDARSIFSSISGGVNILYTNDKSGVGIGTRGPYDVSSDGISFSYGRPNPADFIRLPIEEAAGETAVTVCGGRSLVGSVRNTVAALSNERAIHKGTGAQGIFLHVEEYCF